MDKALLYSLISATGLFIAAALIYIINFFSANKSYGSLGSIFTGVGFIATTAALILHTMITGKIPLSNMFEFGLFFLWSIVGIYLFIEHRYKFKQLGFIVLPIAVMMALWLLSMDKGAKPMMPALRSNWLYIHVLTAILAYGAFAVSFGVALLYLVKEANLGKLSKSLPDLNILDDLTYKIISLGMPFLTLCIVTGAVWAEYAWGTYWSWDPKETWSLITWFIYAIYLHARLMGNWKGKKSIYLALGGFLAVLFTFFGVNLLLPGLHSYA